MNPSLIFAENQICRYENIGGFMYGYVLEGEGRRRFRAPVHNEFHVFILVLTGTIACDTEKHSLVFTSGTIISIPIWTYISSVYFSNDFSGVAIAAGHNTLFDISWHRNPFPAYIRYRIFSSISCEYLTEKEAGMLHADICGIIDALADKAHLFKYEKCYARFYILFSDIADIICKKNKESWLETPEYTTRTEEILQTFMKLLEENAETEYNAGFYADRLCISRQYLAMIVKEKTGMSLGALIGMIRYEIAIRLLNTPDITIQQISGRLGFSDQSAFGKFFRKHAGVSPAGYRKQVRGQRSGL